MSKLERLGNLFGSYKAEWLNNSLFELYTEPSYYPELLTPRPCVLVGGRGTGKTTVLRLLSYEGQLELLKRDYEYSEPQELWEELLKQQAFGFYYRASTPRVTAFKGAGIEEEQWARLFKHYITLVFSQKAFQFLKLCENEARNESILSDMRFEKCAKILSLSECYSLDDILDGIENSLLDIEIYINNIGIEASPKLSMVGALETIFSEITSLPFFKDKTFFLIIDEYENFLNYQQRIINTIIKHASNSFTFKIGARHLGWRVRSTENEEEYLQSPADYVLINIAEVLAGDKFAAFAEKVCNARLEAVLDENDLRTVKSLLPTLSSEEEAILLGVEARTSPLRTDIIQSGDKTLISISKELSDLDLFVVSLWASGDGAEFLDTFRKLKTERRTWDIRISEYRYASLFNIRRGKSGLKKYYAGWSVYLKLCGGNIRYLMELVEKAIRLHDQMGGTLEKPISFSCQTEAAIEVGKKNLGELSGQSNYGAKLTKLTLALGRIFGLLAGDIAGHAPEVNQFRVNAANSQNYSSNEDWLVKSDSKASKILRASVMHLALIPFPGNKPKGEGDIKDDTYQLHPIFAAFFNFSFRKRRNLILDENEVIDLIDSPQKTIRAILSRQNRGGTYHFPDQLVLFKDFLNDK